MDSKKPDNKPKTPVGKSLLLMFRWMGTHGILLVVSFGLLYAVVYLRTLAPLFSQHIIDVILRGGTESNLPPFFLDLLTGDDLLTQLVYAALVFVGIEFARSLLIFMRRTVTALFTEKIGYGLRNRLYRKLQRLGYHFHTHSETGDLIQRCTTDVETYKNFIGDQIIEVVRLSLLVGMSIYWMSKLNIKLMLISLIIAPVLLIIATIYFKKIEKAFTTLEEDESKMTTKVQENVSGARVVKAFANEAFEVAKFDKLNRTFTESDFKLIKKMAIFWSSTDFICFAQFCLIAVFGIIMTSNQDISLGQYMAFLAYAGNIIWPMRQLGRIVGDFSKATVSVGRLEEILAKPDEYINDSGKQTPPILGEVVFDDVSFKFDDSTYHQLEHLSFTAKQGETIAVVGKTGSGKSTMMKLLVRLLDYQNGRILIDGVELKDIEKEHLRNHIGIILQEPFLFSRSVEDNIKIADRALTNDRVQEVAKIARIHDDIVNFEKGYSTIVGERGVTLSGGQKQRVAIARMLLKPKPILIFDDSLSAVDTETDLQIRSALKREWKNSTVFIITHRITTAKEADRIIVLEGGKIQEMGTHDHLLQQAGLYKRIWDIQSKIDFQIEGGETHE